MVIRVTGFRNSSSVVVTVHTHPNILRRLLESSLCGTIAAKEPLVRKNKKRIGSAKKHNK